MNAYIIAQSRLKFIEELVSSNDIIKLKKNVYSKKSVLKLYWIMMTLTRINPFYLRAR